MCIISVLIFKKKDEKKKCTWGHLSKGVGDFVDVETEVMWA